jgi:hypothetical protein
LTDTNSGVEDRTWIRGSAETTTTRTDWLCGPGLTPLRSALAVKFAEVTVTFAWSRIRYRTSLISPRDPITIVFSGWFTASIRTLTSRVWAFWAITRAA